MPCCSDAVPAPACTQRRFLLLDTLRINTVTAHFTKATSHLHSHSLVKERLWDFPILFLSTDFSEISAKLHDESITVSQIKAEIEQLHLFFEYSILPLFFEAAPKDWLFLWAERMRCLQEKMEKMIQAVFLPSKEGLTILHRFCRYLAQNKLIATKFSSMESLIKVDTLYYLDGKEFLPQLFPWKSSDQEKEIKSFLMFETDDMEAALFLLLQRMAEYNIELRKCEFCSRYFRPFSV